MMNKIYKELMILGVLSFVLLLIIEFYTLPSAELKMFEVGIECAVAIVARALLAC